MDGETIRLIVVACGAVIAGLGGALIAGAFNGRNTHATIEAARVAAADQREADRELEHDQWLRDRKADAYRGFISQVREVDQMINEFKEGIYIKGTFNLIATARQLNMLDIRLLAPENVSQAASDLMEATHELIQALTDLHETGQNDVQFYAVSRTLTEKLDTLERLVSQDLRVPRGA